MAQSTPGMPRTAMKPEVSVVIPTHNRQNLLGVTLSTVLAQQGVNLEAIIVDDGSADGTSALVAGIGDPRVHLIRHEVPLGVAQSRNEGWQTGLGEWIAFVDDDDVWAPTKLAEQLSVVRETRRLW